MATIRLSRDSGGKGSALLPSANRLAQFGCVLAALAVWQLVSISGLLSADLLPSVPSVAESFVDMLTTDDFWRAMRDTVLDALRGLAAAICVGIPVGILCGLSPVTDRATRVLVDVGRSFPPIALIPVFLLMWGATSTTKWVIVFISCVFLVLVQAQYGARRIEPMIEETARSYRIPRLLYFRKVVLPSSTPSIMTGVRLATTTSILVAVGVEVLAGISGLGEELALAQQYDQSALAYAYLLAAGLLGYIVNEIAEAAERRLLKWRSTASGN